MEEDTRPKPFVFVLMPLEDKFDDIYQLGIKKACHDVGAYVERVDEQIFEGSILSRIFNQIAKADIIISDMSGRNPNVFYETGYAHALGKRVILLTQDVNDIPFDLKHYQHIVYDGKITILLPELQNRVKWFLDNIGSESKAYIPLEFRVNKVAILDKPIVIHKLERIDRIFTIIIDIHNIISEFIRTISFQVGIITPNNIKMSYRGSDIFNVVSLAEGNLHLAPYTYSVMPGAWETFYVTFHGGEQDVNIGASLPMTIRAFTESGCIDYPFVLKFVDK